jgi:cell wall-associated NlpC family hydrolase
MQRIESRVVRSIFQFFNCPAAFAMSLVVASLWMLPVQGVRAEERASDVRSESKSELGARFQDITSRVNDVLFRSMSFLGLPYKYGGSTPQTGFDCSGLVRWVFGEALGMNLPRRAEELSQVGAPVTMDQLKPGDLVFYNTLRRTFSHVGIYLGNNRFIHAPSSGGGVRIEEVTTPYWSQRFNGARRVVPPEVSQEEAERAAAALSGFSSK